MCQRSAAKAMARSLALWGLEFRLLLRNGPACLVLLLGLAGSLLWGWRDQPGQPAPQPTCYLLYWREDAFLERLRSLRPEPEQLGGLRLEIVPVQRFTRANGLIEYPLGAHSLQLRPQDRSGRTWLVWGWYSGRDPKVLDPVFRWLWQASDAHFGTGPRIEVRVDSLRPTWSEHDWLNHAAESIAWAQRQDLAAILAGGLLFYTACHLLAVSLAEARFEGTWTSIAVSPAGWSGAVWSKASFHGLLASGMLLTLAVCLRSEVLRHGSLYVVLVSGVLFTLGWGWLLGTLANSTSTSAGAGLAYLLVAGLLGALWELRGAPDGFHECFPPERLFWEAWSRSLHLDPLRPQHLIGLPAWAALTWLLAWSCDRRARRN